MELKVLFKNLIDSIIKNNQAFYDIDDEIEWEFFDDEDTSNFAYVNEEYKLMVNSLAVKHCLDTNTMDKIEFYLLVAIRHLFQMLEIEGLEFEMETITDPSIIKVWKEETKVTKESDPNFFNSEANLDAYSYAYGVMKYKYENVDCLDVPSVNKDKFLSSVDAWVKEFNEEIIDNG